MSTVKAKFVCNSITLTPYNKKVLLNAVHSSPGENADFAKSTPWGQFEMTCDMGTRAGELFEPGKEYYIEITAAEKKQ